VGDRGDLERGDRERCLRGDSSLLSTTATSSPSSRERERRRRVTGSSSPPPPVPVLPTNDVLFLARRPRAELVDNDFSEALKWLKWLFILIYILFFYLLFFFKPLQPRP
jgi:hypothetical protein